MVVHRSGVEGEVHQVGRELTQLRHDMRQYVAAGTLLTHLTDGEVLDPEVRTRIESLRQIFLRMDELTRPTSAEPVGPTWLVDVVQLVEECVSFISVSHPARLELTSAGSVAALCDPVMLRRAVINVLDNASRAAGSSGTVQVRVHVLPTEALVEVSDDGDGFGRIPSVSGQGMSIVDRALRGCQGRLEISSGPGPGTTVRMHIPSATDNKVNS
jgi:signal transduction histidine kinase